MAMFRTASGALRVPPPLALAMRPLPLFPLGIASTILLHRICRSHPRIFDRLGAHACKRFGIVPTDLPFAFVLEPDPRQPRIRVVPTPPTGVDARISSTMPSLFRLVEGKLDGDALLFSRELTIEGDLEAVLALRNAIEDASLDLLKELAGPLGPLGERLERAVRAAAGLLATAPDERRQEAG